MLRKNLLGILMLTSAFSLLLLGCEAEKKQPDKKDDVKKMDEKKTGEKKTYDKSVAGAEKKHDGWWCDEHGIPEEECSLCSGKVAKACKAKGDWCEQHERAKSHCFICNPKLKEEFANKYRAKYGKEPPPIEEEKK